MVEMKSSVMGLTIFVAFIVPFLLLISIGVVHQNVFMKVTTEVTEIVKEEGGITDKVENIVNRLNENGYNITFSNTDGETISGRQSFGETIVINYEYQYVNVRGEETLKTQNVAFITRR